MTRLVAVAVVLTMCASLVGAQEAVSGTWEGETRNGASIVLTLKVEGTELTGTLVRNGTGATLTEGKVSGNSFTFKATINEQTETLSGEVADDEMKIWLDRQGASTAIVLRRVRRAGAVPVRGSAAWARAS